jgi:hypothetical protein
MDGGNDRPNREIICIIQRTLGGALRSSHRICTKKYQELCNALPSIVGPFAPKKSDITGVRPVDYPYFNPYFGLCVNISKFTSANFKIQRPLLRTALVPVVAHINSERREGRWTQRTEGARCGSDCFCALSRALHSVAMTSSRAFERALGRKEETSRSKFFPVPLDSEILAEVGFRISARKHKSNVKTFESQSFQ